jgi:hypothetical protein
MFGEKKPGLSRDIGGGGVGGGAGEREREERELNIFLSSFSLFTCFYLLSFSPSPVFVSPSYTFYATVENSCDDSERRKAKVSETCKKTKNEISLFAGAF